MNLCTSIEVALNQLKRINVVYVVGAMALAFVAFNVVHAIHCFMTTTPVKKTILLA